LKFAGEALGRCGVAQPGQGEGFGSAGSRFIVHLLKREQMSFVLDCLYILGGIIASPVIVLKMVLSERWRAGLRERLGGVPLRRGDRRCVWVHAVSVGEVSAARPFVELLERECPEADVRVSTMTNTGQKVARELFGAERCFYFPLDLSCAAARTFRRVRPDVIVLVELEIWPNFVRAARRRGVPVVIVNGRMREERVGVYRRARFLFRPLFEGEAGSCFCVQNEVYGDRFARAGFPAERIRVTGNMKYDAVRTEMDAAGVEGLRRSLGFVAGERVWVAGCTWPGEEEICLRVHRRLLDVEPCLRLVIAPRHVERAGEVAGVIDAEGFRCRRRTGESGESGEAVRLLDTVGELGYCYAFAEFCFVGKSLTASGGHNVLEPAGLGAPPVFGPLTENFVEEAEFLLARGAAERVRSEEKLTEALLRLLREESLRLERVRNGRAAVDAMRGASRRNVEIVKAVLTREESSGQKEERR